MILRFVTVAAVALSLLATVGSAQTAAEVLQKGIYAQQTAGDVDGAIQTYRRVIGMAGADRATAGRAQMQLVSAFLQEGDFPGAAREFNTLVLNYGDQKEVVRAMRTAMQLAASIVMTHQEAAQGSPTLTKGTLVNGVYHHTKTGTEIKVPDRWSVTGDGDSSGEGESVMLRDGSGQFYFVWMKTNDHDIPLEKLPGALDNDVAYKIHQRSTDGVQGFQLRPGTLFKFNTAIRQGVAAAFDMGTGTQVEYDTWVRTEKTFVYFRAICPASAIAMVQDQLQILVTATTIL